MTTDDSLQIRCSRCKLKFRDKAGRVRDGYSRQCPSCEQMMFFLEGSPNKDISAALREAQRVRKALRLAEDEKAQQRAAKKPEPETFEDDPIVPRKIEQRVRQPGRLTDRSR